MILELGMIGAVGVVIGREVVGFEYGFGFVVTIDTPSVDTNSNTQSTQL